MKTITHDEIMASLLKYDENKIAHILMVVDCIRDKDYQTAAALTRHILKSLEDM